jgi:LysM repeat protein
MKQRLFLFLTLLFVSSLLLTACERPLQPGVDSDPAPAEPSDAPEAAAPEAAAPETETAPPADPAPVDTPAPPEEAAPDPADESPRPEEVAEESETAPAEEAEAAEEEAAAAEAEAAEEAEAVEEEEAAEEAEAAVAEPAPAAAPMPATHTVAAGENLYRIGLHYGVSWVTLAQLNNITNPNRIVVGQVLRLPGGNGAVPTPTPSPHVETMHTVRVGENLFRIGRAYNISWTLIAEANGLVNPNQIYVGQVLKIPVSAPGPTPQFTHVVQRGETLFLISLRYGVAWPTVAQANNISSPYVIYVGQTLVIPGGGN